MAGKHTKDKQIAAGAESRPPVGAPKHAPAPQHVNGPLRIDTEPKKKHRRSRGGRIAKVLIIAVVVIVAALAGAYLVLSNTDVFKISQVRVDGSNKLTEDYLSAVVTIPEGTNLLNVDIGAVTSEVAANPWVKSVSVHREFPDTLVLQITDNVPAAVIQIDPATALGAPSYWLISSDGTWMSQVSSTGIDEARKLVTGTAGQAQEGGDESAVVWTDADGVGYDINNNRVYYPPGYFDDEEEAAAAGVEPQPEEEAAVSVCADVSMTVEELAEVPMVSGTTPGIVPEPGAVEADEGIDNVLDILNGSDAEFRSQIASVTSASGESTSLMLKNGVEVAFGQATDIDTKIRIINELLAQHEGGITYINVRVVSRPAWRGI